MLDVVNPPYAAWAALLQRNIDNRSGLSSALGEARFTTIREELLDRARLYTQYLIDVASERGVALKDHIEHLASDGRDGIVMAGHQPVVFHAGLFFKTELLSKLAQDSRAFAIHVVIDTDEGNLSEISWPRVEGEQLIVRRATIANGTMKDGSEAAETILYSSQRIKSREEIREIFAEMTFDLRSSGLLKEADRACKIGAAYERLAGLPLAEANSIVRWSIERIGYREVPLSTLLKQTSLRRVLRELTEDSERLFRSYNGSLERYRREHSIKNAANPFPNLKAESGSYELPLWLVTDSERKPLWSNDSRDNQTPEDSYLATRGSITTMLLRAYCSDLFIHGLGGGKYDRFVTMFASDYLRVELPSYVVTSRTRVIDEIRVKRLSDAVTRARSIKEIVSQTERYFMKGIFSADEEARLRSLVAHRLQMREQLSKASTPEQRSVAAHALNEANGEVREIVQNSALRRDIDEQHRNENLLEQWGYREFPCFLLST
jgi:hypothetical protein